MKHRVPGLALLLVCLPAEAGPPYVTDDPEPTGHRHFEIYAFGGGSNTRDGTGGASGIDFNYGGAPDLQLTAVLPWEYDSPNHAGTVTGIGNIELAAKYKFLHQEDVGWDVAVFPRVFLPSASHDVGYRHASLLIPIWVGRDFGAWSAFGGGGYLTRTYHLMLSVGPGNQNASATNRTSWYAALLSTF
jgi:hypothetical protein